MPERRSSVAAVKARFVGAAWRACCRYSAAHSAAAVAVASRAHCMWRRIVAEDTAMGQRYRRTAAYRTFVVGYSSWHTAGGVGFEGRRFLRSSSLRTEPTGTYCFPAAQTDKVPGERCHPIRADHRYSLGALPTSDHSSEPLFQVLREGRIAFLKVVSMLIFSLYNVGLPYLLIVSPNVLASLGRRAPMLSYSS